MVFYDLNILWNEESVENNSFAERKLLRVVAQLRKYGVSQVALNNVLHARNIGNNIGNAVGKVDVAACRINADWKGMKGMKVWKRLTVVAAELNSFNFNTVNSYDLLAVQPTSEKLFTACCNQLEIDILSLDLSNRLPFPLRANNINTAIQRGITIEVCYSPIIKDSSSRKNFMSNITNLVRATKGRNIIFSSQTDDLMDIRSPYDVMNMLEVFGVSQECARAAITTNCYNAVKRGEGRHTFKTTLSLLPGGAVGTLPASASTNVNVATPKNSNNNTTSNSNNSNNKKSTKKRNEIEHNKQDDGGDGDGDVDADAADDDDDKTKQKKLKF